MSDELKHAREIIRNLLEDWSPENGWRYKVMEEHKAKKTICLCRTCREAQESKVAEEEAWAFLRGEA